MAAVLQEEDFVEARIARLEADVVNIRTDVSELKADVREIRKEVGAIRLQMVQKIGELRNEMYEKIEALRGEMRALSAKIDKKAAETRVWTLMTLAGVLVSVTNVVFHWVKG